MREVVGLEKAQMLRKKFIAAEEETQKAQKGTKEHAIACLKQIQAAKEICEFFRSGNVYDYYLAKAKAVYSESYSEFLMFGMIKEAGNQKKATAVVSPKPNHTPTPVATSRTTDNQDEKPESFEQIFAEMDKLYGIDTAKKEIKSLYELARINTIRTERNLPEGSIPALHMCFYGPPGTGKTTVARLMARLLKATGLIKTSNLIEVDRARLVEDHIGGTEKKFTSLVEQAREGVLFIDEAYTLCSDSKSDFGIHVINALLTVTENFEEHRTVIILAGYEKEMEEFMHNNPGLSSRFTNKIHFTNMSAEDLYKTFLNFCGDAYHFANDGSEERFKQLLRQNEERMKLLEADGKPDLDFANARAIRNYFQKLCKQQSLRLNREGLDEILRLPVEEGNKRLMEFTMEDLKDIPFPSEND